MLSSLLNPNIYFKIVCRLRFENVIFMDKGPKKKGPRLGHRLIARGSVWPKKCHSLMAEFFICSDRLTILTYLIRFVVVFNEVFGIKQPMRLNDNV